MPRPRTTPPRDQTPFARRLQDWMWSQRPPYTNGQLAYRIGTTGAVVWDWLNRGSIPPPARLVHLAELTGIPLSEWYELTGVPVPSSERRSEPLPVPLANDEFWDWYINGQVDTLRASMRAEGVDERIIEKVVQENVAEMRRRQHGKDYLANVHREFAPPPAERVVEADGPSLVAERPADYTEQPTQILQPLQPSESKPPPQQERRAPRKRATAPARRSPRSSTKR